jgi:CheY-like chemotaxis protein/glycine cleavage system H lipoate-binding protein
MERTVSLLVVDDEQVVLDSIKKHLKKDDYEIHTAMNAREALDFFAEKPADIVLTDLMMPEIDGLELMKEIKAKSPNTPVIMITGYATINTALQATQLGAFDYIAKPFTKSELKSVVQRATNVIEKAEVAEREEIAQKDGVVSEASGGRLKTIGEHSWIMVQDDGTVLMGVERPFLHTIGRIQNIFLPSVGDKLRQGSVYIQIFSTDLRSHAVLSPLSGTVLEINQRILNEPTAALEDPYGDGWLVRLKPSKLDYEIKQLGL